MDSGDCRSNLLQRLSPRPAHHKGVARYTADFTVPSGPLAARLPELPVSRSIIQPVVHQIARLGL
jgi:hypothetical protein